MVQTCWNYTKPHETHSLTMMRLATPGPWPRLVCSENCFYPSEVKPEEGTACSPVHCSFSGTVEQSVS